jgi:hypothetical protein
LQKKQRYRNQEAAIKAVMIIACVAAYLVSITIEPMIEILK